MSSAVRTMKGLAATCGPWLDIGVFHPRLASNTERLRWRRWTGIN